jgi:hypothetical protein
MSNLHKDLSNDQLHEPKDFSTAANSTKLTKNSSGNLEWVADSGGGGGVVTSLTTTGTSGASTLSGAGVLNIPVYSQSLIMSQNIEAYGSIAYGTEWGLSNAQYNSEHKFTVNLGSPTITTISPKNMVSCSVWNNPTAALLKGWNGWLWGAGGIIRLNMYRVKYDCPAPSPSPATLDVCQTAFHQITLLGNTSPVCFASESFVTCERWSENLGVNEMIIITAFVVEGEETCTFNLNTNILLGT